MKSNKVLVVKMTRLLRFFMLVMELRGQMEMRGVKEVVLEEMVGMTETEEKEEDDEGEEVEGMIWMTKRAQ